MGFDTAQALHYASDAPAHAGSGRASSFFQPIHHEYDASRPITTGRFRSGSEASGIASTTSLTSSFGNFYLTPGSVPASEAISPTSPPSDISHFFTPPVSHGASPCMQANSVRPRATSLALPCLMRQEENYSFNSGNIYQGDQSQNYLQQNCSIDGKPPTGTTQGQHLLYNVGVSMPYVPIVHGGPQSNLQSDSTNDGFFGSSYITSTAEYPRRASEGIIGQRRRHLIPVRPLQSAPSVAPPDFSTVQSSSPSQLGEAGPPFYTNVPRSYYPW